MNFIASLLEDFSILSCDQKEELNFTTPFRMLKNSLSGRRGIPATCAHADGVEMVRVAENGPLRDVHPGTIQSAEAG